MGNLTGKMPLPYVAIVFPLACKVFFFLSQVYALHRPHHPSLQVFCQVVRRYTLILLFKKRHLKASRLLSGNLGAHLAAEMD